MDFDDEIYTQGSWRSAIRYQNIPRRSERSATRSRARGSVRGRGGVRVGSRDVGRRGASSGARGRGKVEAVSGARGGGRSGPRGGMRGRGGEQVGSRDGGRRGASSGARGGAVGGGRGNERVILKGKVIGMAKSGIVGGARGEGRSGLAYTTRERDKSVVASEATGRMNYYGGLPRGNYTDNMADHERKSFEVSKDLQNNQNVHESKISPIGYKHLEALTAVEPHETLHRLAAYKKGFEALLKENEIRFDLMVQLTKVLANACSCKTSETTVLEVVLTLQSENFLMTHLTKYLREWPHRVSLKDTYKLMMPNLLDSVIVILTSMLTKLPSLFNEVGVVLLCLEESIEKCTKLNVLFSEEHMVNLGEFQVYQSAVERQECNRQHENARKSFEAPQEVAPEDDFHDLSIFPLSEELKEDYLPFLRKNVVNRGYDDVGHYLDIQFRLLREDFVAPLRNGITEYRHYFQKKRSQQQIQYQDVYVYDKVHILEVVPLQDGIAYLTRFSTEHLSRVNWERTRRLLFGSLVCLSSDEFETVHFAVVANRNTEGLKEGSVALKFQVNSKTLTTLVSKQFTMVESSAYFEAYRHVLKRIQKVREDSFPLEKYIVRVDPDIGLPSYLRKTTRVTYDLTPVALEGQFLKSVISKHQAWPPQEKFDLDSSQFEAFKAALTEEICIIQGPPGTGKTFIGLKIVETLLCNSAAWSSSLRKSPIMVICYTNHALDQFLEGIMGFHTKGIVRIGGRSSSEKIKGVSLTEHRRRRSKERLRPKHRYLQEKNIRNEMVCLAKQIQMTQKYIRTANRSILEDEILQKVIPYKQYVSLSTEFPKDEVHEGTTGNYIAYWLGVIVGGNDTTHQLNDDEHADDLKIHCDLAPPLEINHTQLRQRQEVHSLKVLQDYIARNLQESYAMEELEHTEVNEVWKLALVDRWRLYKCWLLKYQQNLQRSRDIAHSVILKEEVIQQFMTKEQRDSLDKLGRRHGVQNDQLLVSFLGAQGDQTDLDELYQRAGFTNLNINQDKSAVIQEMTEYMRNDDSVRRMTLPRDVMLYVAKCMSEIVSMKKNKAERITNVEELSVLERWQLYKYWVSLYCRQLKERLDISRIGILREDNVILAMTTAQFTSLHDESQNENIFHIDDGQLILLWLGAYIGVPKTLIQNHMGKLPQDDGEIDVFGEADQASEERYLEDANDDEMIHELDNLFRYGKNNRDADNTNSKTNTGQNDNWQVVGLKFYIKKNLGNVDCMSSERAALVRNVWDLTIKQRWNLYKHWLNVHKERMQTALLPLLEGYEKQAQLLHEARVEEDVEIIQSSSILALTTTGASKYHHLLQRAQPRIVVVEEAAEVLEAHIVTALTENCEHLILIGDHQQLRPNPTVYELAKRYHLDISLFERLIKNNFPKHRLNLQHRMRPEISHLLKIHEEFYPDLQDHDSVKAYDHVRGVEKDVFFLNHNFAEKAEQDDRSRSNKFEAEFLTGLCRYLLQQEYKPEQITILTAYTGQLWIFKNLMPKSVFRGVRVYPVDSYQGEENDIILLSLVRSNVKGSIGFLKIANRVCVALSRAKIGLYCVGNFSLLSGQNQVWRKITNYLCVKGQLGKELMLRCKNHPTITTTIQLAQDFKAAPEGGCQKPCEKTLSCGHVCPYLCHSYDSEHLNITCEKKCMKTICDLNHSCSKPCCEPCDEVCKKMIDETLKCGHRRTTYCYNRCFTESMLEFGSTENCSQRCNTILQCGHMCEGTCSKCKQGRLHVSCVQPCGRTLVCGHECKSTCTEYCPPCVKQCQNRCKHSQCVRRCGQSCTPCQEVCEWSCAHSKCRRPCGEPCIRLHCDEPCRKILPCKHECIGVCGETCPILCRICDKDEVTEVLSGNEDKDDARFVLLKDCGHIMEVGALDTWMKQTTGDKLDINVQLRVCPKCKTPIRTNLRYGNVIKQVRADVEEIKKQILGDPVHIREKREELIQDLSLVEDKAVMTNRTLFRELALSDPQHVSKCAFTCAVSRDFVKRFRSQISSCCTETQMISLGYKLDMFKKLCEQKRKIERTEERKDILEMKQTLERIFQDILKWLDQLSYISEQNAEDWDRESKRISYCIKLMEDRLRVSVTRTPQVSDILKKLHLILFSGFRFSDENQKVVKNQFQELRKYERGLGVFVEEKEILVKEVDLSAGHWLKCCKGHVYNTGECDGATEKGRCLKCNEQL